MNAILSTSGKPIPLNSITKITHRDNHTIVEAEVEGTLIVESVQTKRLAPESMPQLSYVASYSNNTLRIERIFKNGRAHGTTKTWFPNGDLSSEIQYKYGVKNGKQKEWDANGNLVVNDVYKNGTLHIRKHP